MINFHDGEGGKEKEVEGKGRDWRNFGEWQKRERKKKSDQKKLKDVEQRRVYNLSLSAYRLMAD